MIKWFKRIKLEMSDNSYSDTTNEVKSINRRKRRVAMSDSSDSDDNDKAEKYIAGSATTSESPSSAIKNSTIIKTRGGTAIHLGMSLV